MGAAQRLACGALDGSCMMVLLSSALVSDVMQCASSDCSLYAVDGTCTSVCAACGVLCEAFPIRDLVSLSLYKEQGCNIISGDLYIIELPIDVGKAALYDNLKTVQVIQGHLYIMHNAHLPAMTFFSNLMRVDGISYIDNPMLVDARMPALEDHSVSVFVEGCARLCPARYTDTTESGTNDSECANPSIRFFLRVEGDATRGQLSVLGDVMVRVVQNTTAGQV